MDPQFYQNQAGLTDEKSNQAGQMINQVERNIVNSLDKNADKYKLADQSLDLLNKLAGVIVDIDINDTATLKGIANRIKLLQKKVPAK